MAMRYFILFMFLSVVLEIVGCATPAEKMQNLDIGMEKKIALKIMGSPDRIAANERAEALFYSHQKFGQMVPDWYFVNIVNGKIESFGLMERNQADIARQQAAAAYMLGRTSAPQAQSTYQQSAYQMPVNHPVSCTTNRVGNTAYTNCN